MRKPDEPTIVTIPNWGYEGTACSSYVPFQDHTEAQRRAWAGRERQALYDENRRLNRREGEVNSGLVAFIVVAIIIAGVVALGAIGAVIWWVAS